LTEFDGSLDDPGGLRYNDYFAGQRLAASG